MRIKPGLDLTYCTNIHAGESWDEVEQSIARYALPLLESLAHGEPFGIGLRLSAVAAEQLLADNRLEVFKEFLDRRAFTWPSSMASPTDRSTEPR